MEKNDFCKTFLNRNLKLNHSLKIYNMNCVFCIQFTFKKGWLKLNVRHDSFLSF